MSPDGSLLASGGPDNDISLWDAATGELVRRLEGHSDAIADGAGLAFSPTGEHLASASYDETARLWDVATGESLQVLRGHNGRVYCVAFTPDGSRVATGSWDRRVLLWAVDSGQPVQVFTGHENYVFGLAFVPRHPEARETDTSTDAPLLVSASLDRTLRVWDTDSGVTLRVFQGHTAGAIDIAAHTPVAPGTGVQVFSASNDGTVRRWNVAPLPHQRLVDLPEAAHSAAIAPDGERVAVGFADGSLRFYSLPSGHLLGEVSSAYGDSINRLAFNGDGNLLASASHDNTAKLWDVAEDGKLTALHTYEGHEAEVYGIAFSPDGRTLATASFDGRVGLFALGEDTDSPFFAPFDGRDVNSVQFNQAGTRCLRQGITESTCGMLRIGHRRSCGRSQSRRTSFCRLRSVPTGSGWCK